MNKIYIYLKYILTGISTTYLLSKLVMKKLYLHIKQQTFVFDSHFIVTSFH